MTWSTGTATDWRNLLDLVQEAAVNAGWTQLRYVTGSAKPNQDELVLQGPGFGDGYPVFAQIRTYEDDPNSIYSWECQGITSYTASAVFDQQIGVSPSVFVNLWNGEIDYWLSVTDRRILLIAKISNTYHSMYLGFIAPFSAPNEYPYPMYAAGDAPQPYPFGDTSNYSRCVAFPGLGAAYLREVGGLWRPVAVYGDNGYGWNQNNPGRYGIWPYIPVMQGADNPNDSGFPPDARFSVIPGQPSSLPLMPCYVMAMFDLGGVLGTLEGVFWIPGFNAAAEQVLTVAGVNYIVFIAISRSQEQPSNFYAVTES